MWQPVGRKTEVLLWQVDAVMLHAEVMNLSFASTQQETCHPAMESNSPESSIDPVRGPIGR
jgi:hypothetical protein